MKLSSAKPYVIRKKQRRVPVANSLPDTIGMVWVWRSSTIEAEIAHFCSSEYGSGRFQDPYGVNDYEGLNQEFFDDVTHWCEILPPVTE